MYRLGAYLSMRTVDRAPPMIAAPPSEEAPMSMTGLKTIDETVHVTNAWLHEITSRMGWDDRQKGYRLLRVFFHTLRDRLPVNSAAQLAAQLPMLLRGLYFEGWRPSRTPTKQRTADAFLADMRHAFEGDRDFNAEAAFQEAVSVLRLHISAGELEDIRSVLPGELKTLWDGAA